MGIASSILQLERVLFSFAAIRSVSKYSSSSSITNGSIPARGKPRIRNFFWVKFRNSSQCGGLDMTRPIFVKKERFENLLQN